jgi:signal transduction histidine kinase
MRIYIRDLNTITTVIVKLERLDALIHFWINNDPSKMDNMDLYIPSNVAYDSVLASIEHLKGMVLYQEQRLRLDSLKRLVKSYQGLQEKSEALLTTEQRDQYRRNIKRVTRHAFAFANTRLKNRKTGLDDATILLDRWLVYMLLLAGSLVTLATFYSFSFLQQRRKAESFNHILLETTNNGIVSFKPVHVLDEYMDYEVTYCNDAAMKLLHLSSWQTKTLSTIIPAAILEDLYNAFEEVIQNKTSKSIEGYLEFGQERNWLQVAIAPLEQGVLVSIYNLNPMKAYEQKLTYKIKQLEQANEELQQYAYVTSHDLQEPLRKIQMFSDMGLNAKPGQNKTKDDFFQKVISSASHMRELIQTLLMFTRSTDTPTEFEKVNLNDILKKVCNQLEVLMDERKARIIVSNLPVIDGSEVHLILLFNNLIANSLKYSKPDIDPLIEIKADAVSSAEYFQFPALDQLVRYTKISVHDNGVGFQQNLSDKMFTIFQRLHNKDNTPGTGIGLAICRKIVHQHHGFIYAEGKENVGATFYIFLPFEQPLDMQ